MGILARLEQLCRGCESSTDLECSSVLGETRCGGSDGFCVYCRQEAADYGGKAQAVDAERARSTTGQGAERCLLPHFSAVVLLPFIALEFL